MSANEKWIEVLTGQGPVPRQYRTQIANFLRHVGDPELVRIELMKQFVKNGGQHSLKGHAGPRIAEVARGNMQPSDKMLAALGIKKVVTYKKVSK